MIGSRHLRSRCLYTTLPLRFILFGLGALPIRVAAAHSISCVPTGASQSIRLREYAVGLTGGGGRELDGPQLMRRSLGAPLRRSSDHVDA